MKMLNSRAPEDVAGRVAHIADMMRELRWERGKSAKLIAADWGIPEATVRGYSAEAHRIVMSEVNADEAGRDVAVALRKVLSDSLRDDDRKNAIKAAEVWATVSGAKAAEKHQVGPLDQATPAKARDVMSSLFGSVTPQGEPDGDPQR